MVSNLEEKLPLPYVWYSTDGFIGFSKSSSCEPVLCTCMEDAVYRYLTLREQVLPFPEATPAENFLLDPHYWPARIIHVLQKKVGWSPAKHEVIHSLTFEPDCCHVCQRQKPLRAYCTKREGTRFRQQWGWYIHQQYFHEGVVPRSFRYLIGETPADILEWIGFTYEDLLPDLMETDAVSGLNEDQVFQWLQDHDQQWVAGMPRIWDPQYPMNFLDGMRDRIRLRQHDGHKAIENRMRKRVGVRAIGDRWVQETELFHLLKASYPKQTISRHYRPKWLGGLELDMYLHEAKIGVEYQGIQHYKPLKHWGGKKGLGKVQQRDKKKKQLCKDLGIALVEFTYEETLTEPLVRERIEQVVGSADNET